MISVLLTGRDHWATVNRLIATCLDKNVYQTVASFVPNNYDNLGNLEPTVLRQCIQTRLVNADHVEYKKMQFELAKQTSSENQWKYKNRLLSYYRSTQIKDESRFVAISKKDV